MSYPAIEDKPGASAQQQHELRVFGFTVVPNVLTTDEARAMREFVLETEARVGVDTHHRGIARHLANVVALDPMFLPMIDHPRVLPLVESLMGENIILGSLSARIVRPGDPRQTLHSDVPMGLARYGHEAPVMMNTVWALQDASPENGATWVVPGSHQSGLLEPPAGFDVIHAQQPTVSAGSVIVFHGQTWHGGGANRSIDPRVSLFGHYRYGAWLRFQCDPHEEFQPEWLDAMTDRQKSLLRMTQGINPRHGADFYER